MAAILSDPKVILHQINIWGLATIQYLSVQKNYFPDTVNLLDNNINQLLLMCQHIFTCVYIFSVSCYQSSELNLLEKTKKKKLYFLSFLDTEMVYIVKNPSSRKSRASLYYITHVIRLWIKSLETYINAVSMEMISIMIMIMITKMIIKKYLNMISLTRWGRATNTYIIGAGNGLTPVWCQTIIDRWLFKDGWLMTAAMGTHFRDIKKYLCTNIFIEEIQKCCLQNGSHFVPASIS